ncbi:MAG: tannase/feruloyl esterase family alpha/beta hydrolase [Candidatus Binataceae bacterium]
MPVGTFGAGSPEECLVTGTEVTNPADGKTANFGALLPDPSKWNVKFMFQGCGGNCGSVGLTPTVDVLNKGYPVWATDDGHQGPGFGSDWQLSSPGVLDEDAIIDFAYRAVHTTVVDGKQFTENFYDNSISYSYYEGCSDGGREGMIEANRYPADFDGVLAGDPYFDVGGENLTLPDATAQFRFGNASGFVPPALFNLADQYFINKCDTVDGVKDGLVQDPELCNFNPETDLPRCSDGASTNCFTQAQIDSLTNILTALTDRHGTVIRAGFPEPDANLAIWAAISVTPSNFTGPEPWPNLVGAPLDWVFADTDFDFWIYLGQPGYNSLTTPGFTYHSGGAGRIRLFHTVAPDQTIDKVFDAMNIASGDFPNELSSFISQGRKLILYHGLSDGLITPYFTIPYYRELAGLDGGFNNLESNVLFFAVPGMYHCGGGYGPTNFGEPGTQPTVIDAAHDATTALEDWVEKDVQPQEFIGTNTSASRTMPLCPFPEEAQYSGSGDVNDAANWTCPPNDHTLLRSGFLGRESGADAPLFNGEESQEHGHHHGHDHHFDD